MMLSDEKIDVARLRKFQEEQKCIRRYVVEHSYIRPKTGTLKFVVQLIIYISVCIALTVFILNRDISIWISHAVLTVAWGGGGICILRNLLILSVRIYQKYAKVTTRQKCLCMPSCSEYAISAIRKYGVLYGLIKIRKRLFTVCKGEFYRIDVP